MTAGLMPRSIAAWRSLHRHAARLDRAAPARDLACDELREILRGPAIGGGDFLADRLEAPAHRGQVERLDEPRAELLDDRGRRALGEEQALPGQHVEIETLLLGGCDGPQGRRALQ